MGNGTFNVPGADAVDASGNLYVLDANRGTLQKFSNTGGFIASISSANSLPLPTHDVAGIVIDPSSNDVFVADPDNTRLIELNSSLVYQSTIATGPAFISVAAGGGLIYTLDITGGAYRVEEYNTTPTLLHAATLPQGDGPGELAAPNANGAIHDQLAVDANGVVYVTDADNQRVLELNSGLEVLPAELTGFTGYPQSHRNRAGRRRNPGVRRR